MEVLNKFLNAESVQAIDKLLANIANALNISVDMLKENGMHYVLEYGKYEFWSGFVWIFLFVTFLMIVIGLFVISMLAEENSLSIKSFLTTNLILCVIAVIILITTSLPYIMSPEMYSIKKVIELLQ